MALDVTPEALSVASSCLRCPSELNSLWVEVFLTALWSGVSTDPQSLSALSAPLQGMSAGDIRATKLFLLATIAGGSLDPNTLATDAACYACLSGQYPAVRNYLLANIASSSTDPEVLLGLAGAFQAVSSGRIGAMIVYALAVKSGAAINASALSTSAACFRCANEQFNQVSTSLLADIGGGAPPPFNCTTFPDTTLSFLTLSGMSNLQCLNFPVLHDVASVFTVTGNPVLTSIKFGRDVQFEDDITVVGNPLLKTITLQSITSFAGFSDFTGNALDQPTVDSILAQCVFSANPNGNLFLNGGTNAHPSAAGLTSKAILVAAGWTVTNN